MIHDAAPACCGSSTFLLPRPSDNLFVERLIMFGNESNSERRDWSTVEITPTTINWAGLRTVSAMHVTALNALQ